MGFEQQLIDFFLTNKEYNNEFILDLINLLKCNLGKRVISSDNPQIYAVLTDNFYIFVSSHHYINCKIDYYCFIVYKSLGFVIDIGNIGNESYLIEIHNVNYEKLKMHFENNDLFSFERTLSRNSSEYRTYSEDIEYIFATTTTKSARKL